MKTLPCRFVAICVAGLVLAAGAAADQPQRPNIILIMVDDMGFSDIGQSLKPLLTGDGTFADRPLFWEHEGNAAIRVGDRKLVRLGSQGRWELFDLKADRTEQNDLAGEHPEEVASLASQWRQWAKSAHVLPKPTPKSSKNKN